MTARGGRFLFRQAATFFGPVRLPGYVPFVRRANYATAKIAKVTWGSVNKDSPKAARSWQKSELSSEITDCKLIYANRLQNRRSEAVSLALTLQPAMARPLRFWWVSDRDKDVSRLSREAAYGPLPRRWCPQRRKIALFPPNPRRPQRYLTGTIPGFFGRN